MKTAGITAEYNPLHNGHVYNIREIRRISGCDAVCVAMSGDYVQRGEPAVTDKWNRARMALSSGADLVVEIPVAFCLGNASQYASAGVAVLEALGCSCIAFGGAAGDTESIKALASFMRENEAEIESGISMFARTGMSYPAAREAVILDMLDARRAVDPEACRKMLKDPNCVLGIEYVKHMKCAEPLMIKRIGARHDETADTGSAFQSASALRAALEKGEDILRSVPEPVAKILGDDSCRLTFPDAWFGILKYAVITTPADVIEECPSGGEGLGHLMKQQILKASTWDGFIMAVKSKRYTYARISRLCMQVILGIRRHADHASAPAYIRVLGFTGKGREVLSALKKEGCCVPVITNINKASCALDEHGRAMLELDVRAADIYNSVTGRDCAQQSDHVVRPVVMHGM